MIPRASDLPPKAIAPAIWDSTYIVTTQFLPSFSPTPCYARCRPAYGWDVLSCRARSTSRFSGACWPCTGKNSPALRSASFRVRPRDHDAVLRSRGELYQGRQTPCCGRWWRRKEGNRQLSAFPVLYRAGGACGIPVGTTSTL